MRLIITDVTEMHGGNYCVAGWDFRLDEWCARCRMAQIGPPDFCSGTASFPVPRSTWSPPGSSTRVRFLTAQKTHSSTPLVFSSYTLGPIAWLTVGAPPTHATVAQAFGRCLVHSRVWNGAQQGVHVPENTQIGSLSAVELPVGNLTLFEDNYQGKRSLRAYLDDGHACYNLPVVARDLREAYRLSGVYVAKQLLPVQGNAHVRLGLARAWQGQPGKCSLMINGIYG